MKNGQSKLLPLRVLHKNENEFGIFRSRALTTILIKCTKTECGGGAKKLLFYILKHRVFLKPRVF